MSSQTDKISMRTLILGTLVVLLAMGVRATFGLFMQPMGLAHGWGRDVFSMAFALQNLVWGGACIFMGILADRYGSGRTIALGAVLYMLGMIGTRFATDETTLYLTAGVLVGLGQAGTTFPVILPVVARSVPPAYRSTAMGIASAGGSMGQFAVVPTGQVLINGLDWPGALWVLSCSWPAPRRWPTTCAVVRRSMRVRINRWLRRCVRPCGIRRSISCSGATSSAASIPPSSRCTCRPMSPTAA